MSQLLLPIFPSDTQMLTQAIGVREYNGKVLYLLSGMLIYSHSSDDHLRFRYITSIFLIQGLCKNQDVVDFFRVSSRSVRSWKKKLSEEGEFLFFEEERRHDPPSELQPEILVRIQSQLDKGESVYSIAKKEGISEGYIRYQIKKGNLKKNKIVNRNRKYPYCSQYPQFF